MTIRWYCQGAPTKDLYHRHSEAVGGKQVGHERQSSAALYGIRRSRPNAQRRGRWLRKHGHGDHLVPLAEKRDPGRLEGGHIDRDRLQLPGGAPVSRRCGGGFQQPLRRRRTRGNLCLDRAGGRNGDEGLGGRRRARGGFCHLPRPPSGAGRLHGLGLCRSPAIASGSGHLRDVLCRPMRRPIPGTSAPFWRDADRYRPLSEVLGSGGASAHGKRARVTARRRGH